MSIVLPYLKPPAKPHSLHAVVLKAVRYKEIEATGIEFSAIGYEIGQLFGTESTDFDSLKVAVLEPADNVVPLACYTALFDLISGNWKYMLARTRAVKSPINFEHQKSYPRVPKYSTTEKVIGQLDKGIKLLRNSRRFRISLERWSSSHSREDALDTVLDLCSSLEAAFALSNELRLRLSLAVYHMLSVAKKQGFLTTYQMYGVRNKFIHGAQIPEVQENEREQFIEIVCRVLLVFLDNGEIPNEERINQLIISHYSK